MCREGRGISRGAHRPTCWIGVQSFLTYVSSGDMAARFDSHTPGTRPGGTIHAKGRGRQPKKPKGKQEMTTQNLVNLSLTETQIANVDAALTTLETELAGPMSFSRYAVGNQGGPRFVSIGLPMRVAGSAVTGWSAAQAGVLGSALPGSRPWRRYSAGTRVQSPTAALAIIQITSSSIRHSSSIWMAAPSTQACSWA